MIDGSVIPSRHALVGDGGAKEQPKLGRLRPGVFVRFGLVVLIVAVAALSYLRARAASSWPEGVLQVSGRVEGDAVMVASKQPGRVSVLKVREGEEVSAGQVVVELDDSAARARLAQALAAREVAAARVVAARAQLKLLRSELPLQAKRAAALLKAAQAAQAQAEAAASQARRDRARSETLVEAGAMESVALEKAELAFQLALEQTKSTRAAEEQAKESLADARLAPDRVTAKEAEILGLEAAERQAAAVAAEAEASLADLTIKSPVAGTVTVRLVNLGEVVNAGAPLLEVVDLDHVYLRAFIPESDVGRIRLGLPVRIHTDAFPDRAVDARVSYIASRAEFTPKDAQTRDERVRLVFATKLAVLDNVGHRLTPGLTADAVIRWQEQAPWVMPR